VIEIIIILKILVRHAPFIGEISALKVLPCNAIRDLIAEAIILSFR
jgi:hypothetical protein